jgi:hypothetical protein
MSQRQLADEAGMIYNTPWDADKHYGCLCDIGRRGKIRCFQLEYFFKCNDSKDQTAYKLNALPDQISYMAMEMKQEEIAPAEDYVTMIEEFVNVLLDIMEVCASFRYSRYYRFSSHLSDGIHTICRQQLY